MSTAESIFCPSLQKQWSVRYARYSGGTVTLHLEEGTAVPFPDPRGRDGKAVLSEPRVFKVRETADITFKLAFWFEIVEEASYSTSGIDRNGNGSYVGEQFRCYTESALLSDQRKSRTGASAANLKHYQLVTPDEIINVISSQAPEIVLRQRSEE